MGLNVESTKIITKRFKERFEMEPTVESKSQYGSEGVSVEVDEQVQLSELIRLKEGVHNTMSLSVRDGKLRISVW